MGADVILTTAQLTRVAPGALAYPAVPIGLGPYPGNPHRGLAGPPRRRAPSCGAVL